MRDTKYIESNGFQTRVAHVLIKRIPSQHDRAMYKNAAQAWLPIIMACTAARGVLSHFEKGVIVGVSWTGAPVTKAAQLADVSQATVFDGAELQEKDITSKGQRWAEVHTPGT